MENKKNSKKVEHANSAENKKQNQDFPNIPAATSSTNPPDINKEDIQKASKSKTGKTDNTK
ncbi:hypothetical protein [Chryseobacterium sp.]|uniref:hypothetical protein n=1 Tax=Chryseobacterium sp. TaxID=1871047 RepID=UPI00388EFCE8